MKKLCVIFGGASSEHDISIITGMQLAKKFNREIEKIYFGLDNKFYLATHINDLNYFSNKEKIKLKEILILDGAVFSKGRFMKKLFDVECVVNCCHGGLGENGDLFAFFNVNKIKCTSAKSLYAHIAMNKSLCKKFVSDIAKVVKGKLVTKSNFEEATKEIEKKLSTELIVKPNSLGSSIGVKVCDKTNFKQQIEAIFELKDDALVEERVVDIIEYNQACFKTEKGLVISAIEQPISKNDFLTFEDKYKSNNKTKLRDRVIPAEISQELEEQISSTTLKIYDALKMDGVVRIDYIFDNKTKTLYFNEVNTIPGSMAFYLFEPLGIDYITLIEETIENASKAEEFTYFSTDVLNNKLV